MLLMMMSSLISLSPEDDDDVYSLCSSFSSDEDSDDDHEEELQSFGCWRHIAGVGGSDITSHELPRTAERTEIEPKIVWTEPRPPTTSIELNHEWDRTSSHKDPP
jgi:hypothetical protein